MRTTAIQVASLLLAVTFVSSETIQLEPTQGILIPAEIAHALRITRNTYGGSAAYSAPAAQSYSAPAAPSYVAPAAPSYVAPAAPSYAAPAAPSYVAPAPSTQSYSAPQVSSYSSSSIPAPPCPQNYLFSCQPSLSPVACSAPSSGYQAAPSPAYSPQSSSYSAPSTSYSAPSSSGSYPSPAAPSGAYSHLYPQFQLPLVHELY